MEEMSESEAECDTLLKAILELLVSAGYSRARESSVSAFDKVSGGLAWCIAATNSSVTDLDDVISSDQTKLGQVIEDALKSIKCPYPIQAHQVQLLDYEAVYPVVQWLVCHVLTIQASIGNEAAFLARETEEEESNMQKLKNLLIDEEISVKLLHEKLEKQELAVKLRANVLLKRRCDDVPSQTELIQYEHRFSELYVQIQEKLRQTRKYYATYNALLEIKELMLKEISLLDSISSQDPRTGRQIGIVLRSGGRYYLQSLHLLSSSISPAALVSSASPFALWHSHLGHLSLNKMKFYLLVVYLEIFLYQTSLLILVANLVSNMLSLIIEALLLLMLLSPWCIWMSGDLPPTNEEWFHLLCVVY